MPQINGFQNPGLKFASPAGGLKGFQRQGMDQRKKVSGGWTPLDLRSLLLWADPTFGVTANVSDTILTVRDRKTGSVMETVAGTSDTTFPKSLVFPGTDRKCFANTNTTGLMVNYFRLQADVLSQSRTTAFAATYRAGATSPWAANYPGILGWGTDVNVIGNSTADANWNVAGYSSAYKNGAVLGPPPSTPAVLPMLGDTFVFLNTGSTLVCNPGQYKSLLNDRVSTADRTWEGYVGDIVVCGDVLSTEDRQKLEGFLAHRWSNKLPTDHPYKNAPP